MGDCEQQLSFFHLWEGCTLHLLTLNFSAEIHTQLEPSARMRSEGYSSRSVGLSVRASSRTTGYEAANEWHQRVVNNEKIDINVAIFPKRSEKAYASDPSRTRVCGSFAGTSDPWRTRVCVVCRRACASARCRGFCTLVLFIPQAVGPHCPHCRHCSLRSLFF